MSRVRGRVGVVTAGMLAAVVILSGCSIFGPTVTTPTPTAVPITGNVCPAWTNPPAPVNIPAPSGSATTALAANNDARVLQTPRPIRSLYRIQQEVVKHLAAPIGCLARTSPRNEKVGQSSKFWVTDEQSGYKQVTARLVYVTPHLYMYLADGAPADVDGIIASAKLFERQSFPTDERTYGPHWSPGPDDDPHITVLNTGGLGNVGGYFSSEDEYPTSVFQYSNERQMIYVNLDGNSPPGTDFYNATLAHEFQHMIHWYWHPADPSWANEGMSVLAQHINHFDSGGVDQAFLQSPDTMLGGWTDDQNANVEHYGAGYLFMDYFAEHYGGYGVLKELLQDPAQTPLNFDDVLAKHGYKDTFNDVFAKFVVANLVNDPAAANGIYAYPTIQDQQVTVQDTVSTYPFTDGGAAMPATVHQYAAHYYKFQGGGAGTTLNLTFAGSPYTTIVGNSPFGGAANEWWSNSGDDMDATLTHAFDLSALAGRHVALTFDAWYDLEPDFDYAYVEVSTDGGKNWTTVPTSTSTTKNPYGANIGNGMTSAAAGPAGCALTRAWTPETADLSAYAGKQVQVRFEVITDDAVHCQGLTLDNIQVPALGFKDNIASDNGWVAAGFIRSNNVLPEHWLLQAVLFPADGSAPTVRQIAVDPATGKATTAISGLAGTLDNVTVVVTAMAPSTVVPARYTLSAHVG